MKKKYSKPQILFDSFELSESIATGCVNVSNHSENMCSVMMTNIPLPIFTDAIQACVLKPQGPGQFEELCYSVPLDDYKVYSS